MVSLAACAPIRWSHGASLLVTSLLLAYAGVANAECLSLTKGNIAADVQSCAELQPEAIFDYTNPKFKWIKDLDQATRLKLLNSYRGLLVKAHVVKSNATQVGLTAETGVLNGETHYFFIPPGEAAGCAAIRNKRVTGVLNEACCEGGGQSPCLLGTSYQYSSVKAIGAADSDAGDAARQRSKSSDEYKKAMAAMRKGDFKSASKFFEQADTNGALDVKGHFYMGLAYRKLDMCDKAVRPLERVYNQQGKGKIWADEEQIARKAIFLLARCHSKMNDPQGATLILNGYLLEPTKYRRELRESQSHQDFGWIKTSKEYKLYVAEARKRLRDAD